MMRRSRINKQANEANIDRSELLELSFTRWLAIRAHGPRGIRASVLLVLWLTTLCFIYLVSKH